MAHAVNRHTKQVIADNATRTEDTPFDENDWFFMSRPNGDDIAIQDFENLRLAGVPVKYWNLQDGPPKRITEMTASEKEVVDDGDIEAFKNRKVEEIDKNSDRLIDKGYEFQTSGGAARFSLQVHSQINLTNMLMLKDAGMLSYPITYASIDDKKFAVLNGASDVLSFYVAAFTHIAWVRMSGTALKKRVHECTTTTQVKAVEDTRS